MKVSYQTGKMTWPTLQGRLMHALTTREEAVRQLQTTMQITPLAKAVLSRSKHRYLARATSSSAGLSPQPTRTQFTPCPPRP
jgi:hypothetical protein